VIAGRPAVVVGHSYGGTIALGAALVPGGPGPILALAAYEPPLPWLGSWSRRSGSRADPRNPAATEDPAESAERFFRRMVGDTAWERLPAATKAERRADGPALAAEIEKNGRRARLLPDADAIVQSIAPEMRSGDVVAILSNGGFGGIYEKLPARLRELAEKQ